MPPIPLTESEVEQYRRDGYLVFPAVLGRESLERIESTIAAITRRAVDADQLDAVLELEPELDDGEPIARRIYNPFERHDLFREIATDRRILDRIESLVGSSFNLQHSKLNMKPPRVGSVVEWHQDLAYFPHTNDDLVTTLIYLDEATEENGCLQVLPGQHHRFFDHNGPDGEFAGMITEELDPARFGPPRPLPAPAGSVIFMHCLLPHSSLPNRSDTPRRTLIFEYRAADSFPIYFSQRVVESESMSHRLRGAPAQFARFGGPPPLIPSLSDSRSLYQLQLESKAKARSLASELPSLHADGAGQADRAW